MNAEAAATPKAPAAIDVVIPTYNNLGALRSTLDSLAQQVGVRFRAVVCIDGSTDGTAEFLRSASYPFDVSVGEHPGNAHRGRAATRNLARSLATANFVAFLDSDMRLRDDALAAHAALLEGRPCISVGAIVYQNARENLWARYLMTRGRNRFLPGAELPFGQFMTANSALRTKDFLATGGFDERVQGYGGEDIEFAYRLGAASHLPMIYNAQAIADTVEPKPLAHALGQLREYGRTNLPFIQSLHPEMPAAFMTDRLASRRIADRLFVAAMNPVTDATVAALLPIAPFAVQRRFINYQVIRAVTSGYRLATR